MKKVNSFKSLRKLRGSKIVRRKGRLRIINKLEPRNKARQG